MYHHGHLSILKMMNSIINEELYVLYLKYIIYINNKAIQLYLKNHNVHFLIFQINDYYIFALRIHLNLILIDFINSYIIMVIIIVIFLKYFFHY